MAPEAWERRLFLRLPRSLLGQLMGIWRGMAIRRNRSRSTLVAFSSGSPIANIDVGRVAAVHHQDDLARGRDDHAGGSDGDLIEVAVGVLGLERRADVQDFRGRERGGLGRLKDRARGRPRRMHAWRPRRPRGRQEGRERQNGWWAAGTRAQASLWRETADAGRSPASTRHSNIKAAPSLAKRVRLSAAAVAAERRLKACQLLGWTEIPVRIVDLEAIVRGEFAENAIRKDFLPSEAVAIASALRPVEQAAAKERQREHGATAPGKHSGQVPTSDGGRARDKVAAFAGIGARSLDKATAIVAAAEAEPERFAGLVADMDRTGRVDGPFKRLKVMKQAEAIRREPPPLPQHGPYRVIVADPPWPYELRKADPSHRATPPYPPMSIDQIRAMPVAGLAHEDCILWLWTTNHHMREAFTVLDAWGFEHKTILTWAKDRMGMGDWNRNQHELLLVGSRGNIPAPAPGTQWPSVVEAPVGAHSAASVRSARPRH